MINTEILEVDKEEHEKTITELHSQAEQLEATKEATDNLLIREMSQNFILQIEKEIEYQEFHIQELENSIKFEDLKNDKD